MLLGNHESNFVPNQDVPPTPEVVLRDAIRQGVAASWTSSTPDSSFLTEDDMAAALEAVKQKTAALAATINDNNLRRQSELRTEKDAISSEDIAKNPSLKRRRAAFFKRTKSSNALTGKRFAKSAALSPFLTLLSERSLTPRRDAAATRRVSSKLAQSGPIIHSIFNQVPFFSPG